MKPANNLSGLSSNRSLMLVFVIIFFSIFTSSISSAVSVLFALELGATVTEVSLINMLSGLFGTILQLPFGIFSDRVGRKFSILLPEIIICVSDIARSYATTSQQLIIISPFGHLGVEITGLVTAVGDLTEPHDRPNALGIFYVCSSLGMFIGPSIASLLLFFLPIRMLYWVTSAIHLFSIVAAFKIRGLKKPQKTAYKENISRVLRKKNLLVSMDMHFSRGFFEAVRRTYVPILAKQGLHLPDPLIVSLGSFEGITRIVARSFLGKLISKMTVKKLMILTCIAEAAAGLSLPFASSFYHFAIFACLAGFYSIEVPLCALLVADSSTDAERGFANAVLQLGISSGSFAQIMTIPIVEAWGTVSIFPVASILPITAILVALKFMEPLSTERREGRKEEKRRPTKA